MNSLEKLSTVEKFLKWAIDETVTPKEDEMRIGERVFRRDPVSDSTQRFFTLTRAARTLRRNKNYLDLENLWLKVQSVSPRDLWGVCSNEYIAPIVEMFKFAWTWFRRRDFLRDIINTMLNGWRNEDLFYIINDLLYYHDVKSFISNEIEKQLKMHIKYSDVQRITDIVAFAEIAKLFARELLPAVLSLAEKTMMSITESVCVGRKFGENAWMSIFGETYQTYDDVRTTTSARDVWFGRGDTSLTVRQMWKKTTGVYCDITTAAHFIGLLDPPPSRGDPPTYEETRQPTTTRTEVTTPMSSGTCVSPRFSREAVDEIYSSRRKIFASIKDCTGIEEWVEKASSYSAAAVTQAHREIFETLQTHISLSNVILINRDVPHIFTWEKCVPELAELMESLLIEVAPIISRKNVAADDVITFATALKKKIPIRYGIFTKKAKLNDTEENVRKMFVDAFTEFVDTYPLEKIVVPEEQVSIRAAAIVAHRLSLEMISSKRS